MYGDFAKLVLYFLLAFPQSYLGVFGLVLSIIGWYYPGAGLLSALNLYLLPNVIFLCVWPNYLWGS